MGTLLRRLLASGRVHLACSPVYSLLFMDLSHSLRGVLFDNVDWQWAYKLHKYSPPSLYALIYIQYMYDALCLSSLGATTSIFECFGLLNI